MKEYVRERRLLPNHIFYIKIRLSQTCIHILKKEKSTHYITGEKSAFVLLSESWVRYCIVGLLAVQSCHEYSLCLVLIT